MTGEPASGNNRVRASETRCQIRRGRGTLNTQHRTSNAQHRAYKRHRDYRPRNAAFTPLQRSDVWRSEQTTKRFTFRKMKRRERRVPFVATLWSWILCLAVPSLQLVSARAAEPTPIPPKYEFRELHDPNGIGKFYLGREIAHVMGHPAADWLERPEREEEEKPGLVLQALKLKPGDAVADIGAGTGYFSWRMAKEVGAKGKVYGVDLQPEMLELLAKNMAQRGVTNVVPVRGTIEDTRLPTNSVDLVIMVDVYHEFSHPYEMMQSICRSLKPGGRVVFVEYRAEDPAVPIKRVHKMSETQVRKEMEALPLEWVENSAVLPRQHIIVFRKQG